MERAQIALRNGLFLEGARALREADAGKLPPAGRFFRLATLTEILIVAGEVEEAVDAFNQIGDQEGAGSAEARTPLRNLAIGLALATGDFTQLTEVLLGMARDPAYNSSLSGSKPGADLGKIPPAAILDVAFAFSEVGQPSPLSIMAFPRSQAAREILDAADRLRREGDLQVQLGLALLEAGDTVGARRAFKAALKPGDVEIDYANRPIAEQYSAIMTP